MEKLIEDVLERLKESNLHSAVARQNIIRAIMKEIRNKDKGFFLNMNRIDADIPEVGDRLEEEKWTCAICGKSTFKIDFDHIGSKYNHLQCDLKEEVEMGSGIKHFKDDLKRQVYVEMTSDGLPEGGDSQAVLESRKLVEEISSGAKDLGYVFESPDKGKTIFKRKIGENKKEEITKEQWEEYNRNR